MKLARILLACTMLLAIVFRSLPDSVFDYFHNHEHGYAYANDKTSISNYKHNCHIDDWNFESFEITENHYNTYQLTTINCMVVASFKLRSSISIAGIGRAPPVA